MPAYFARGSGHNAKGQYSERANDYVENVDRLSRKFETARAMLPRPEVDQVSGTPIGIVAFGTSHWAVTESRDQLREEAGLETSYLRLRAYPFSEELGAFVDAHERIYIVEQNRDAQMLQLMKLELTPARVSKLRSVRHYNGLPIDARSVSDAILAQEGQHVATTASAVTSTAAMLGGE
jgi:2-oxoglutarate ferredoxin oxidoreductase subunit alpha